MNESMDQCKHLLADPDVIMRCFLILKTSVLIKLEIPSSAGFA